ncbi:PH domain-containing protein [Gracilibacillus kekensis]|uniref:PH domain-containing protein n=1 Tax=Gracilibacillus kekensis TaxID=1027249 RepID=A0A1M7KTV8_9BACI|nr:PH domain-containing protein [Gracilibacillus kekensis]SHM68933.1 PH domain-containing protein [Gracilibacillus kekensis]
MIFRSKMDRTVKIFLTIVIFILAGVTLVPILFVPKVPLEAIIILSMTFLCSAILILWPVLHIKYIFYEDYLLIIGGPFRNKITYEDITRIEDSHDLWTGYRILSSKNGIEIFYKSGFWGSIKISPDNKQKFINELLKRNKLIKTRQ